MISAFGVDHGEISKSWKSKAAALPEKLKRNNPFGPVQYDERKFAPLQARKLRREARKKRTLP